MPPHRRRAARAPVARKALQGRPPGTRARVDASRERQADEAAAIALRGGPNASRGLTPAPAARHDAPSSTGRPLPDPVRQELEGAFGADLAAVRVHADAAAHAAARREEAEAFTAGRRIFFGEGRFDPASRDGRRLLGHEVAHVLQQTGRRLDTTLIQATDREGGGEIQRAAAGPVFRAAVPRHARGLGVRRFPGHDEADDDEREG